MTAEKEKRAVAFFSVCAAVVLTAAKLAVGLWTNSLGILSEAAHSGLDLLAAGMTLWAVSVSCRPADERHAYGHGKVENLSALFQTLLLLLTTVWIVWEAFERLFFHAVTVEVTAWSFGVIIISIVINMVNSRALRRTAQKHHSQALEAGALDVSADVWSSSVVLAGLAVVWVAGRLGLSSLARADSCAALGVALLILGVCWRLGRKSLDDLLDAVPPDLQAKVTAAAKVEGVAEVRQARVRRSGPNVFADIVIAVARETGLERSHEIANAAEAAVRAAVPGADVLVHVEPFADKTDPLSLARALAARHGLSAHSLRVYDEDGGRSLELHLEVSGDLRLDEAHRLANLFEADLRQDLPDILSVVSHIEPDSQSCHSQADPVMEERARYFLGTFLTAEKIALTPHELKVHSAGKEVSLRLRCAIDSSMSVLEAHELTAKLERHLRSAMPKLTRVVIHVEPAQEAS